jgi:hypothetical protein
MFPKLSFLLAGIFFCFVSSAQVTLSFPTTTLRVDKSDDETVVIPVQIAVQNTGPVLNNAQLQLVLDVTTTATSLPVADRQHISLANGPLTFTLPTQQPTTPLSIKTLYIKVAKELVLRQARTVNFLADFSAGGPTTRVPGSITITLAPNNIVYTLADYSDDRGTVKLDYVEKVESNTNVLTVYGYNSHYGQRIIKRQIGLQRYEVYTIGEKDLTLYRPRVSLLSVPFKIRPRRGDFKTTAISGLNNLGVNLDFFGLKLDRYFSNGNKAAHRFALGVLFAPSVEELDSLTTKGFVTKTSKQLFLSAGFNITYAYNNLTFAFIPLGYDFATSTAGKSWAYNKKRWWGFGIGVDPKIFSAILNK